MIDDLIEHPTRLAYRDLLLCLKAEINISLLAIRLASVSVG